MKITGKIFTIVKIMEELPPHYCSFFDFTHYRELLVDSNEQIVYSTEWTLGTWDLFYTKHFINRQILIRKKDDCNSKHILTSNFIDKYKDNINTNDKITYKRLLQIKNIYFPYSKRDAKHQIFTNVYEIVQDNDDVCIDVKYF